MEFYAKYIFKKCHGTIITTLFSQSVMKTANYYNAFWHKYATFFCLKTDYFT